MSHFNKSNLLQYKPLSEKAWRYLFGTTRDELNDKFFSPSTVQRANPGHIHNRVKLTAHCQNSGDAEENMLFDLTHRGYKLPEPIVDEGSDQDMGSNNEIQIQDSDDDEDIDSKLSKLWRQFLVDLTAKAPNLKNASSPLYCKLSAEEHLMVNDDTHKNCKLSDYWADCQWKIATKSEWTLIFDHLWPPKNKVLNGSVQNYNSTAYYLKWTALTSNSDIQTVTAMEEDIRRRCNTLFWLPHPQTDCIWHTKFISGFQRSNRVSKNNPALRILINWKETIGPTW